MSSPAATIHDAPLADVDPLTLYAIIALRIDVFVVEQNCVYRELDGRDAQPSARLVWAETDEGVAATLRLLCEDSTTARIGRVATAASARGRGLAAQLVGRALELSGDDDVVLDAQAHLAGWYERFGFRRSGPDFIEDGIAHTPMRRDRQ
ncbi:MAG: GNAT family N-acetyltransferase [Actinomycetota bacterium]|nr:GNAT family N-acetyltransferase [Actinomycetota bacterium]